MIDYKSTLRLLCAIPSMAGCEAMAADAVRDAFAPYFDAIATDPARNILLTKKSKKITENAPRILLDAHFDEVGMLVSGITDEGMLRVMPIGGIDRTILPASEVWIYGGRDLSDKHYGVIAATPPHLVKPGGDKTPDWADILIDIGCSKAEAERIAPIGTPVGYYYSGDALLGDRLTGRGLDDKCCAAALITLVGNTAAEDLDYDVTVVLSSGEEVGGGGAASAVWTVDPDYAIVTDVNFALTPGVSGNEGGKLGAGPMLSLSAVTDRALTKKLATIAEDSGIHLKKVVEPTSTGTNASSVVYVREGVPTAVLSIPIAGMHSYNELLSLADAEAFMKLLGVLITGIPVEKPAEDEKTEEKDGGAA